MKVLKRLCSRLFPAWWRREHTVLSTVLVAQGILAAALLWPRPASRAVAGPLLADFRPEEVAKITIRDAQGTALVLERQGDWVLGETDGFPAKPEAVNKFLNNLASVRADRLVARTEVSQRQLRVAKDAYEREVTLEMASGQTQTVYLGTSPAYGVTHIRLGGRVETYLTDALTVWNVGTAPASWIDTSYVSVPEADVTRIVVKNAQGEFALIKGAENKWALEGLAGEAANDVLVTSLATRAISIYMVRPLGKEPRPEYGLEAPQATVVVEAGEKTVSLAIGARDESGNYAAKSSGSPYYVRLSEYTVKDYIEKGRADLLQAPATPTPATAPTGQ